MRGLPTGALAAIASIICLQVIASPASTRTFAAASIALILPSALAFRPLVALAGASALDVFALVFAVFGDFVAAVLVVFFADMVHLPSFVFRSAVRRASAEPRRCDSHTGAMRAKETQALSARIPLESRRFVSRRKAAQFP
jgi:hypothetical protein